MELALRGSSPAVTETTSSIRTLLAKIHEENYMERNVAELEQLHRKQHGWSKLQHLTGATQSTGPVVAPEPLNAVLLFRTVIQIQVGLQTRVLEDPLNQFATHEKTASITAFYVASSGAQAYVDAIAAGQSEVDALATQSCTPNENHI